MVPLPGKAFSSSGAPWCARLKEALREPCAIVTLGNRLRGDDGVGPEIYDRLESRCPFSLFEGGLAPENLLGPLVRLRPRTILLVDAVHFEGAPGEIRLFLPEQLAQVDISTHAASPKLLLEHLQCETGAGVYLLGVQPGRRSLGQSLSEACRNAAETIAQALIERPGDRPPEA